MTIKHFPEPSVVLAEDETEIRLFPLLRSGWAKRGHEAFVPITGRNEKCVVFGTLNIQTGHRVWLIRENNKAIDFQQFLKTINYHYRKHSVLLLLDEDARHTAFSSLKYARQLNIQLLWLPKRSPHLNPMDHLWRHGKYVISSNHQYESVDEHVFRFVLYLDRLSNRQALKKAGLLSESFWLYPLRAH